MLDDPRGQQQNHHFYKTTTTTTTTTTISSVLSIIPRGRVGGWIACAYEHLSIYPSPAQELRAFNKRNNFSIFPPSRYTTTTITITTIQQKTKSVGLDTSS